VKIIRVGLIILGIVLLVGGIAVAITNLTAGDPLSCSAVAERNKELEKVFYEWRVEIEGAEIETSRELELKKNLQEKNELFFQALRSCHEARAVRILVTIVSLIVGGIGFLLTIVGFFIGRKKDIT
jgi:hypothetical protein